MAFEAKKSGDESLIPNEMGKKGVPPNMPGKPSVLKSGDASRPEIAQGYDQVTKPKSGGNAKTKAIQD